ncbi:TonB-dependent receptor domain-containing protein [Foliimonas ilicis]|uniref:TonB-dependent receptor domain-containing protein n=1 Tax=Mesorhizobium sp. SB112 TaxID=3151853 RepID=UPI003263DEDB
MHLLRAFLIASTAIVPMASAAQAQTAARLQPASFDIAAQSLSDSLAAFARAAGLRIAYPSELAQGRSAPALQGPLTQTQALDRLLSGSGLAYRFTGGTSVTVYDPSAVAAAAPIDADGSLVLDTITITSGQSGVGWDGSAETVYTTPAMVSHVSSETIERYRGTTSGDILKGVPGVLSGANRTSGGIDPNIQGLQGMGRVAVTVDGAANAMTSYHGYQGISNRSYIDPDFIGGVSIEKGPGIGATGVGAIGGSVSIRTINADDIIPEGQNSALRINAEMSTNNSTPPPVGTRTLSRSLLGYLWTANNVGTPSAPLHDIDRPGLLLPTGGAGSVTYASRSENFDLVLGASRRKIGNYHVGSNGSDAPSFADICATATGAMLNYCNSGSIPYHLGLTTYLPGEEVLNTSQDIITTLAKATFRYDDHTLELINTRYDSVFGETGTLGFVTSGTLTDQNLTSTVALDTYAARYRWNPENDLLDVRFNISQTSMDEENPAGIGDAGVIGKWSRIFSADLSNTSRLDTVLGPAMLNYGGTYKHETTAPSDRTTSIGSIARNGARSEGSAFVAGTLDPTDWLQLSAGARYHAYEARDKGNAALISVVSPQANEWDYNIGASVTPIDGLQLFANYKNAARMPSLVESISTSLINVNPAIRPERSSNIQLGANLSMDNLVADGDSLKLKVGYFHNTVDDFLYRKSDRVEIIPGYFLTQLSIDNLEKAKFSGLEFSGQYDAGSFSAAASATYYTDFSFCRTAATCINSSLGSDYATNHVPPKFSASLTLSQKLLEDRLTLSGRATYHGKRAAAFEPVASGANPLIAAIPWNSVLLFDAYAEYKLSDQAKLTLGIENLTDQYYVDPLSIALVPAPGRTIKFGFSGTFDPENGLGLGFVDGVSSGQTRDWSGFYAGGSIGGATISTRVEDHRTVSTGKSNGQITEGGPVVYEAGSASGFVGGVRAGYDHQFAGNIVLGADVEAGWGSIAAVQKQTNLPSSMTMYTTYDMLASASVRLGYAFDDILIYGKAGLGAGRVTSRFPFATEQGHSNDIEDTTFAFGLAAGAGVEYALTDNFSIFGEYQHLRLNSGKLGGSIETSTQFQDISWRNRINVDLVKIGMNYRF